MGVAEVIELVKTGGPAALSCMLLWMWWIERKDRKAAEAHLIEVSSVAIETNTKIEVALNQYQRLVERILDQPPRG